VTKADGNVKKAKLAEGAAKEDNEKKEKEDATKLASNELETKQKEVKSMEEILTK